VDRGREGAIRWVARMMRFAIGVPAFLVLTASAALAQGAADPDKIHVPVARKVAPAVVYVEGGSERGSGVIVDPSGIILSSPTACGKNTTVVTVVTSGNRQVKGKVIGRDNARELVVVKIDAPQPLPFVELGDSAAARVGQVSYVFGDCYESIVNDDQAAMSLGVISGLYAVDDRRGNSLYVGPVIETSAAVNPNQDGGPLVDRDGKLLGLVSLNYDESKFTGLAVPIHVLKPSIDRIRKAHAGGAAGVVDLAEKPKKGNGWAGLEVAAGDAGLDVSRVSKDGPADRAGLRRGDRIRRIDGAVPAGPEAFEAALAAKSAGDELRLRIDRDGQSMDVTVTLTRRPVF
jgi:S1-C subfamily serine protease